MLADEVFQHRGIDRPVERRAELPPTDPLYLGGKAVQSFGAQDDARFDARWLVFGLDAAASGRQVDHVAQAAQPVFGAHLHAPQDRGSGFLPGLHG